MGSTARARLAPGHGDPPAGAEPAACSLLSAHGRGAVAPGLCANPSHARLKHTPVDSSLLPAAVLTNFQPGLRGAAGYGDSSPPIWPGLRGPGRAERPLPRGKGAGHPQLPALSKAESDPPPSSRKRHRKWERGRPVRSGRATPGGACGRPSPAIVCAYSRLPKVNTCSSYSLATFSRNSLQCGRRRVCSIGSPRPSWKWRIPCTEGRRSAGPQAGTDTVVRTRGSRRVLTCGARMHPVPAPCGRTRPSLQRLPTAPRHLPPTTRGPACENHGGRLP